MIATPIIGMFLVRRWMNAKGKQSIFRDSKSLEDVGLTYLHSLGKTQTPRRVGGGQEFRPTWGMKLGIPFMTAVALGVFMNVPRAELWDSFSLSQATAEPIFLAVVGVLVLHIWVWMSFFHVVEIDGGKITVVTQSFQRKSAQLSELQSVTTRQNQPLYEATFKDGQKLVFTKFISDREDLLEILNTHIFENKHISSSFVGQPKSDAGQRQIRRGSDGFRRGLS
ncbi:MAG: hypothetical protein AAF393_03930 [Pseudomonadota bacterium]